MGLATTNTMTGGLFKKKFGRKKKIERDLSRPNFVKKN